MACLPLYHKEMRDLPQIHPKVYNEFINGNFTIQHKQGKANEIWSDLALEKLTIKGAKTFLKGVTQKNNNQCCSCGLSIASFTKFLPMELIEAPSRKIRNTQLRFMFLKTFFVCQNNPRWSKTQ